MSGPLLCPRDGTTTQSEAHKGRFGHFTIDVCPKCEGVWFDHGEVAKLYRDREMERLIVDYAAGPSRLTCPRCGHATAPRPVGGFTIDVCPSCRGIWFGRDELEAAAEALGTEEARTALAEEFADVVGPGVRTRRAMIPLVLFAPGFHAALTRDLEEAEEKAEDRLDDL